MTWDDFRGQVRALLLYDADVPEDTAQTWLDALLRSAVIELQQFIPSYRAGQVDTYDVDDVTAYCDGATFDLPSGAFLNEIVFAKANEDDATCPTIHQMHPVGWDDREHLVRSKEGCYGYAIDPRGRKLFVFPAPVDDDEIRVTWTGIKYDYDDGDLLPWDESAVRCVAEYINAEVSLKKDDKAAKYDRHYNKYRELRRQLYLDDKHKRDADQ